MHFPYHQMAGESSCVMPTAAFVGAPQCHQRYCLTWKATSWLLDLSIIHDVFMEAVTELLKLVPHTTLLLIKDAKGRTVLEEEVPVALVQHGDLLKACALLLVLAHPA